jgi:DNA invertase Pin-like site-specific DNA recombinase
MLTVLGGLAEFERELIKARTAEGRKRAQARGVKFGRPSKLTSHQRREAVARLNAGESQVAAGITQLCAVHHILRYRIVVHLTRIGVHNDLSRSCGENDERS